MVAGDKLLVGSCSGNFFVLDRQSGAELWHHDTRPDGGPMQFHGDPAERAGIVVTGSDSGDPSCTYALDLDDGALRWKNCESFIETDILLTSTSVLGRAWNGDVLALDLDSGRLLWRAAPQSYLYPTHTDDSPQLQNGVLYVGQVDGAVHALAAESGESLWVRPLGSRIVTLAVDGERLCAASADGKLHRLSASDGRVVASSAAGGKPLGQAALADGVFVLLLGRDELAAFDADRLLPLWRQPSEAGWTSYQPRIHEGAVLAGDAAGRLSIFDLHDGTLLGSVALEGHLRGLGASESAFYIGTLQGEIYAVTFD